MKTNVSTRRQLALITCGALLAAGGLTVTRLPSAGAMALPAVVATVRDSGGRYVAGGASLAGADCSGLVSVVQSLAMGEPVHRLGNTHTLLAGRWPHAIPGASPDDVFIIGANPTHMVVMVQGVRLEARTSGQPFLVGDAAASPFDRQFSAQFHIPAELLVL